MDDNYGLIAAFGPSGQVDFAPHNKGVTPVFFIEPVQDFAATEREGRAVYVNKERVRVHVAGDPLSAAAHPVDAGIIARYREQYEKWKRGKDESNIVGTPLSKWPMATPNLIRELEFLNVFSVEDLVNVSDANVQNFTDGRALREKAIAWLAAAKDTAAAMRYATDNQKLRDEMAELRKLVTANGGEPTKLPKAYAKLAKPRKASKPKRRKSAWTPERRAAQSAAMKAMTAQRNELVKELHAKWDPRPKIGNDLTVGNGNDLSMVKT